jgi:predicted dehydrogenase
VRNFAGHDGIEDLALAQLEFASGAQAQLASVWHNVLSRPSSRRLELFFENGYFHVDNDFSGPIYLHKQPGEPLVISEGEVRERYLESIRVREVVFQDALRYSLQDYFFLESITAGRPPFPDFGVALEAHRIVDAIYRSAAGSGEKVTLR